MIENSISIAEKSFEQFIPLVKQCYPHGKLDRQYVKSLVEAYQKLTMSEDIIVALYDNSSASVFFVSDNVKRLHYTPEKVIKWGGLLLFKGLHFSHYSFAFNSLKQEYQFVKQLRHNSGKNKIYCGGLKIVDGKGKVRRVFMKGKQVQVNQTGQTSISVYFLEEIDHLVKSDHYWFRLECNGNTLAHIQQKGKKVFDDLLSAREKDILKLLAQNKSSQEIADELFLSKLTIETHRKNMIKRVGAINSTAMVHLCKMANLI